MPPAPAAVPSLGAGPPPHHRGPQDGGAAGGSWGGGPSKRAGLLQRFPRSPRFGIGAAGRSS
eukprot:gene47651-31776_t